MANVNVIKETGPDQNLPEWPTKRYGAGAQVAERPSALEVVTHAPWQSLAVLLGFTLIVALLAWRWRAVYCYDNPGTCAEQSDRVWTGMLVGGFLGSLALAWYTLGRIRSALSAAQADAEQRRLTRDRFANPVDVRVFTRPGLVERTQSAVAALQLASDLEEAIAPHKRYSGVNTLTEGSHEESHTEINAQGDAEQAPAGVPSSDWLRWIDDAPHLMIAGRTAAGKTTLASAILAERIQGGDEVLVIDPHDQPDKWYGIQAVGGGRQYGAILAMLDRVVAEMDARYQAFNGGTPTAAFPRLTVLVDEVPAIMDACLNEKRKMIDARWSNFARQLGSEARKVRISVILLTQSALVQDIGVNTAMRKNFSRIALGDETRQLLNEETKSERRETLAELIRGQAHPAVMEYKGEIHMLNTADVPTLAAQNVRSFVRVWRPSAAIMPPAPAQTPINGRTDGRTYTQDKIKVYLAELAKRGRSREWARQWAENRGLRFENKLWTDALEEARKIEAL